MSLKKSVFTIFLSLVMCVSTTAICTYAEEAEADTAVAVNEARASKLRSLGVVYELPEGENEDLSKQVTRAEFAKLIVKFLNKVSLYQNLTQKPYVDVELTDDFVRDIKVIKDLGIVSDAYALKFRPKEIITLGDAALMLMRGLGYTTASVNSCVEAGLFDGISKTASDTALLDDIYAILENGLNVELMVWEYNGESGVYKLGTGKTILTEQYEYEWKKGLITANSLTGMADATSGAGKGNIAIDNIVYAVNGSYDEYIGYQVNYYVTDDATTVAYIEVDKKNKTTRIDAYDINTAQTSSTQLAYYQDGNRARTLKLESELDVIYNGKAYYGYGSIDKVMPHYGYVVALDNDDDGRIELLNITDFEYYKVGVVDNTNFVVYDAKDNTAIDLSDSQNDVVFHSANGKLINFTGIKLNSVISIAKSKNSDGALLINVYVCDKTLTSTASAKDDDYIIIDDEEYKTTDELYDSISVGVKGVFYLTHDGRVAFFESASSDTWSVAVVNYVSRDEEETVSLSLYTTDGDFVKYPISDKVNLAKTSSLPNGAKGPTAVMSSVEVGTVVRYRVNEAGEIFNLELPDKGYTTSAGKQYTNETGLRLVASASNLHYRNNIIDGRYAISKNTETFIIPPTGQWNDYSRYYTDISNAFTNTKFDYSYPYQVYVYDENDIGIANVVVFSAELGDSPISNESQLYTVGDIKTIWFEDDTYYQVTTQSRDTKGSYLFTAELLAKYNIKKGDVIQLIADKNRHVKNVSKIFNADGSAGYGASLVRGVTHSVNDYTTSYCYNGQIIYGTVERRSNKFIEFNISTDSTKDIYIGNATNTKLVLYDSENKTLSQIDFDSVRPEDNFVALISSGIFYDFIVIR